MTSRILLRIRGERVFEVPPLATTDAAAPASVTRAASSPAVELFVERARAVKPDFALTPRTPPLSSRSARHWTACRSRSSSRQRDAAADPGRAYSSASTARCGFCRTPGVTSRSDSARCAPTIEWSTELLTEDERRLLWDLGVFSAGFTLDAVESIGAGRPWEPRVVEALEVLVDSSLVSQSDVDGEPVFSMLATVREYAVDTLARARRRA